MSAVSTGTAATAAAGSPAAGAAPPPRRGRPPGPRRLPARLGASAQARRQAALILDVLAGARTPTAAAAVLEVPPVRYYQLEARAVDGLVAACEPRTPGRPAGSADQISSHARLVKLEGECRRLEAEVARLQALLRMSRLTLGVKPPSAPPTPKPGERKARRARVRALKHARTTAAVLPTAAPTAAASSAVGGGAARA